MTGLLGTDYALLQSTAYVLQSMSKTINEIKQKLDAAELSNDREVGVQ